MRQIAALSMTCCLLASIPCRATDTDGAATVPPHIAGEIPAAHLVGEGNYRWFGLKIYTARLWAGSMGYQGYDAANPGATGFALDLHYLHAFDGKKIAERSVEEIEKLGLGSTQQRLLWLKQMAVCFPNVENGTHLTGIFVPGVDAGVRYFRDGKPICEIKGREFATAFFAIWLDARTSAQGLREALLSKVNLPAP